MDWVAVTVRGVETEYMVSESGAIRNRYNKELKPSRNRAGYLYISIRVGGKKSTLLVHRVVAESFLGSPSIDKPEVDHIDRDRSNNSLSNLEWVSRQENAKRIIKPGVRTSPADSVEDLPGEAWKEIEVSPGKTLKVSDHGRVLVVRNRYYGTLNAFGYRFVRKAGKTFLVHRLVAQAFIPIASTDGLVVHHVDSNRENNKVSNLEWATLSHNAICGTVGKSRLCHTREIRRIDHIGEVISYPTLAEAAATNGVSSSNLCRALRKYTGTPIKYKSYTWEYGERLTKTVDMTTELPLNEIMYKYNHA